MPPPLPLTDDGVVRLRGDHEPYEEQTQIFFSTSELDELRALSRGPALSSPELGSVAPPASPHRASGFHPAVPAATGFTQREVADGALSWAQVPSAQGVGAWSPPAPAPPYGNADPRQSSIPPGYPAPALGSGPIGYAPHEPGAWNPPEARRSDSGVLRLDPESLDSPWRSAKRDAIPGPLRAGLMAAAAFALGGLAYYVTRTTTQSTASITIEDVGDPDALVRVDGIVRGNPPLTVDGLLPGAHRLELQSAGAEMARSDVDMEPGEHRVVRLIVASAGPAAPDEAAAIPGTAPASSPLSTAHVPAAAVATELPVSTRERRSRQRAGGLDGTSDPANEPPDLVSAPASPLSQPPGAEPGAATAPPETPPDSTELSEANQINPETAAKNQGEVLISTLPWSHVLLDGVDTGRDTPIRSLVVPAGPHTLGLRTPDGETHEIAITVQAGRIVRIVRRF
jgi:hypothetical protein